ncbi:Rab-GTPase-TBC domain [Phytophthora infestans]|uniref:Rab-GTPase-TBC domain n=1 Tax=Phytophthora infestans TaxID=4787 RepID=A0A833SM51_PHYIN|nr:Rab-GTPase-TBC domain [Phytophthora infestans]KAF4136503.1 Rab-GTPase-TBC domain [Phytophthora infestans]
MAALRYEKETGLEERAILLTEQLAAMDQVNEWKHAVKKEFTQSQYSVDQVQSLRRMDNPLMYSVLEKMGLLGLIKRTVIDLHCEAMQTAAAASKKHLKNSLDDGLLLPEVRATDGCSLDAVRAARDNWEKITSDEMMRVANELGQPLVAPKTTVKTAERDGGQTAQTDGESTKSPKPNKIQAARFLYDGIDLLRSLQAIEPPNRAHESTETSADTWGSIQLQLYSPPFPEYRRLFSELAPEFGQIGLDELFPTQRGAFIAEKIRVGDLVLAHQSVSMARQYSKTGCPVSLRPQIWRQVLSVPITALDQNYYAQLQQQVAQWAYLTDDMYLLDLQQTINSCDYFVFQDHLESVLMAFTRDTYVKAQALQVNGAVTCSLSGAGLPTTANLRPQEAESRVPPNGVLPFSGLVMYLAPLAYLFADPVEIYYVFRELYIRYWSKLNVIRTERGTILPLCKLFEDLIVRSSPAAVFHLRNIGLKPLDVAFPWIQSAFSGVLDIDQVLLLWDRVIGYDSLEIVVIFAAALFSFRADELECVSTREEVDDLFTELIDIPVVTLLQDYLFGLQYQVSKNQ